MIALHSKLLVTWNTKLPSTQLHRCMNQRQVYLIYSKMHIYNTNQYENIHGRTLPIFLHVQYNYVYITYNEMRVSFLDLKK